MHDSGGMAPPARTRGRHVPDDMPAVGDTTVPEPTWPLLPATRAMFGVRCAVGTARLLVSRDRGVPTEHRAPNTARVARRRGQVGQLGMRLGGAGAEHLEDGLGVAGPARGLRAELPPSLGGELVVLGLAVILGEPPLRVDPT